MKIRIPVAILLVFAFISSSIAAEQALSENPTLYKQAASKIINIDEK